MSSWRRTCPPPVKNKNKNNSSGAAGRPSSTLGRRAVPEAGWAGACPADALLLSREMEEVLVPGPERLWGDYRLVLKSASSVGTTELLTDVTALCALSQHDLLVCTAHGVRD